ncbi:hypothetical protein [Methylocella sp.]|uniref:hypothetical protein n=1 Tax=Methylocella sp. TaxID=1978226 RepID=UPI00378511FC
MSAFRASTVGALVLAACALAPGAALAQRRPPPPAAEGQWYEPDCPPNGYSAQAQDRARYDCSGTRGRMGLGASPFNPEGPGNPSFGGR